VLVLSTLTKNSSSGNTNVLLLSKEANT